MSDHQRSSLFDSTSATHFFDDLQRDSDEHSMKPCRRESLRQLLTRVWQWRSLLPGFESVRFSLGQHLLVNARAITAQARKIFLFDMACSAALEGHEVLWLDVDRRFDGELFDCVVQNALSREPVLETVSIDSVMSRVTVCPAYSCMDAIAALTLHPDTLVVIDEVQAWPWSRMNDSHVKRLQESLHNRTIIVAGNDRIIGGAWRRIAHATVRLHFRDVADVSENLSPPKTTVKGQCVYVSIARGESQTIAHWFVCVGAKLCLASANSAVA